MIIIADQRLEWAFTELKPGETATIQVQTLFAEFLSKSGLNVSEHEVRAIIRRVIAIQNEIAGTKKSPALAVLEFSRQMDALTESEVLDICVRLSCVFQLRIPEPLGNFHSELEKARNKALMDIANGFGDFATAQGFRITSVLPLAPSPLFYKRA